MFRQECVTVLLIFYRQNIQFQYLQIFIFIILPMCSKFFLAHILYNGFKACDNYFFFRENLIGKSFFVCLCGVFLFNNSLFTLKIWKYLRNIISNLVLLTRLLQLVINKDENDQSESHKTYLYLTDVPGIQMCQQAV